MSLLRKNRQGVGRLLKQICTLRLVFAVLVTRRLGCFVRLPNFQSFRHQRNPKLYLRRRWIRWDAKRLAVHS